MAIAHALALQVGRREAGAPHRGASRGVRFCAALAAALIALAFVYVLRGSPATRDTMPPRSASIAFLLPRERPMEITAGFAPPPRPARPVPKVAPGRAQTRQAESATAERTTPPAPVPGPSQVEAPPTAAAPASAPLDLSDRVIRSAIAHSKGAVRQLAEGSGQELDTPRAGRDQQLANAAGEAGVPGCLRPDALKHDPPKIGPIPIPGIFAAPFVVHAAITGKCQP